MSFSGFQIRKVSGTRAWGAGLIAMDIVEADGSEFAATGGSCGNVMAILAWFGWASTPIARFGTDAAGQFIRTEFDTLGLDASHISCESRVDTPIVIQRFGKDKDGQRTHRFSLTCPECGAWLPRHRPITLKQSRSLGNSGQQPKIFYFDRVSPGAIQLAKIARERGALIVFEPASVGDENKFQQAVECCHVLKYSQERLGNAPDLAVARAPKLIVETQGRSGLRFRWRNRWTHLRAITLDDPVDAAGSGDWCTATLIHGIGRQGAVGLAGLRKSELVTVLRTGQAIAAINCQYYGARGAMMVLSLQQINRYLQHLSDQASALVVEESSASRGAKAPEFCRRCEPMDAAIEKSGTIRSAGTQ